MLYLNDGYGRFSDRSAARLPPAPRAARSLLAFDVDADGDPDLVRSFGVAAEVLRNDGSGVFSAVSGALPPLGENGLLAAVDLQGDGVRDLVVSLSGSVPGERLLFLVNGGAGRFFRASSFDFGRALDGFVVEDFDRDGDPDVLATAAGTAILLDNDGNGLFVDRSAGRLPAVPSWFFAPHRIDYDGDGSPDVLLVPRVAGDPFTWLQNDGRGAFRIATVGVRGLQADAPESISVVDLDLDGDEDLVFTQSPGERPGRDFVWINDGAGGFTQETSAWIEDPVDDGSSVALVMDVDGDGDPDLLVRETSGSYELELQTVVNTALQIEAPYRPILGSTFDLEIYARHPAAPPSSNAVPLVSPGAASIPAGRFGILRLDPALLFDLPSVTIPQPGGRAQVQLAVPNQASLLGAVLHFQAWIDWRAGSPPRLSNAVREVVLR